jgi:hypothetical protein
LTRIEILVRRKRLLERIIAASPHDPQRQERAEGLLAKIMPHVTFRLSESTQPRPIGKAQLYRDALAEHCMGRDEALTRLATKYRLPLTIVADADPDKHVASVARDAPSIVRAPQAPFTADELMLLVVRMAAALGEPGFGTPPPAPDDQEGVVEYRKLIESGTPRLRPGRPSTERRDAEIAIMMEDRIRQMGEKAIEAANHVSAELGGHPKPATVEKIYSNRNRDLPNGPNNRHFLHYIEEYPGISDDERQFLRLIDRRRRGY